MSFPVLSIIVFTPMAAAVLILMIPAECKNEVRVTALAAAVFALILSLWVFSQYLIQHMTGYQFQKVAIIVLEVYRIGIP